MSIESKRNTEKNSVKEKVDSIKNSFEIRLEKICEQREKVFNERFKNKSEFIKKISKFTSKEFSFIF